MSDTSTVDVDLDALAPAPKRVKLAGKVWKLPGDMPMELFIRTQAYESRVEAGEDEAQMLMELQGEILALFKVHQPTMKSLPPIGLVQLLRALGQIYGGEPPGEQTPPANRAARRARTRTPSNARRSAPAT
jgi:hypothetical protein